jgi:hypothetical protein
MPPPDATLTIAVEATAAAPRTLVLRCPHAVTTLPLPAEAADGAAERAATSLAILQHYSTTACACGRVDTSPGTVA